MRILLKSDCSIRVYATPAASTKPNVHGRSSPSIQRTCVERADGRLENAVERVMLLTVRHHYLPADGTVSVKWLWGGSCRGGDSCAATLGMGALIAGKTRGRWSLRHRRMRKGDTMSPVKRNRKEERRPESDCRYDRDTGEMDEQCVRDYLARHMPLAV